MGAWGGRRLVEMGVEESAMLKPAVVQREMSEEPAASSLEPT